MKALKKPNPFEFKRLANLDLDSGGISKLHKFAFNALLSGSKKGGIEAYTVYVEEYDHHVCAVKFFRDKDSSSGDKYKYRIRTNCGTTCAYRIFDTCMIIILSLFKENYFRSFIFYGVGENDDDKKTTQRYRVYKQYMLNYLGVENFDKLDYEEKSVLLMLNKHYIVPNLVLKIEEMFSKLYNI